MVKSLLRKYSGIILLSTDKIIAEKLQKALSYNKCQKLYNQIFWALCVGVPVAGFSNGQKDIYLKEIKTKENINRYTMTDQISNSLITRREVHKHDIACECISRNDDTNSSYFKFSTNSIKHHCLNIFAAQKLLCPILGDHFYSQQLKFLNTFNSRVLIHPSECEYKSQHLPPQTKRALSPLFPKIDSPNSSSGQTYDIPCMLHLGSLTLRIPWVNDSNSAEDLTISCPPPPLFTKTKSLLELD
ncbi:pseudouridylate synthase RPUSD4, mitochondrial-like [Gordionus sp. m RMFG-2023]|uniref:pseudouridylate synthase RPUSD4, mitochondrial-like n=1 Tax=Gordionus sp. m RMFG-2023 TaxID=3053472 RepID=UPI0031FD44C4